MTKDLLVKFLLIGFVLKIPINLKTSYPSNSNGSIQSNQSFKNT